jgi:hypothetical protein
MTQTSATTGPETARPGLISRFVGVIVSPRETYAHVVAAPRWAGMLGLVLLVSIVFTSGFMLTEVGQVAALDTQVERMEAFGVQVDDRTYQRMEEGAWMAPYTTAAGMLVMIPLMTLIVAGILFAVFTGALGAEATFRQVFAVVVHAGAISALQQAFTIPLNYVRESMSSPTNLAVFFPMLDETGFAARFLGTIDLFLIWWVVVLAIGLAVLYRRRTGPIAATLLGVYGLIALAIAVVMGRFGG